MSASSHLSERFDDSWRSTAIQISTIGAVGVSIPYLTQPVIDLVMVDYGLAPDEIAWLVTASQIGYALGVFFLVPLGDSVSPRRQLTAQGAVGVAALVAAAVLGPFLLVCFALFAASLVANTTQILARLAARFSPHARSGAMMAYIGAATLIGLFGGRIIMGFISDLWGWRVGFAAFALLLAIATVWSRQLIGSDIRPFAPMSYRSVLTSMSSIFLSHPSLRWAGLRQGLLFVAFSILWTTIVLQLTNPDFGWSTSEAGLVGLVGLASVPLVVLAGPYVGRYSHRLLPTALTLCLGGCVVAWVWSENPIALIAGVGLITLGSQISQVVHQDRLLREHADQAARANTVYIFLVFLGGAIGAFVGPTAYAFGGMSVAAALAVVAALVAVLTLALDRGSLRPQRRR